MSITFPTIITVSDYRNFQQGNNSPLRDEDISSAINTTFVQLDGICNSQISIRWGIIDENDPDFLNATKKGNIQKAFLLQTKYNLDYDNDTSEGTTQSNWGSNSTSITRPKRDKISQDVLNYLTLAGVYVQFTTIKGSKPDVYCPISPKYDPRFDNWATKEWANQSFIPKQSSFQPNEPYLLYYGDNKQAQSKKFVDFFPNGPRNSFLFLTSLGKLKWIPIEDIGYDGYWGLIGGDIEDQVDLMNYFAKYYVKYQQGITDPTNSTYSAQEIDDKISESAAVFRGTYTGGTTRPASFDYDTYCKNQMTIEGITPTNNDYLFIHWTELEVYDRCKYTLSTNTWSYEYTINQIAQKQADWDQTDSTQVDYIKNKPTIPTEQHLYKHTLSLYSEQDHLHREYPEAYFTVVVYSEDSDNFKTKILTSEIVDTIKTSAIYNAFVIENDENYPIKSISSNIYGTATLSFTYNYFKNNAISTMTKSTYISSDTVTQIF